MSVHRMIPIDEEPGGDLPQPTVPAQPRCQGPYFGYIQSNPFNHLCKHCKYAARRGRPIRYYLINNHAICQHNIGGWTHQNVSN